MYGNQMMYGSPGSAMMHSPATTQGSGQKKRNVRPSRSSNKKMNNQRSQSSMNGHMMSPVGGTFTRAPQSMSSPTVYSPHNSLYGAGSPAHLQAQSIYAGLGSPMVNPPNAIYQAQPLYTGLPSTSSLQRPHQKARSPPTLTSSVPSAKAIAAIMDKVLDPEAQLSPWFLSKKPREDVKKVAVEILRNGAVGEFFVRDVSSQPGNLGLSIKTNEHDLVNYLLKPTDAGSPGISIRGTKEVFPNLTSLIEHYRSKLRPALPCKLVNSSKIRGMLYYSGNQDDSEHNDDDDEGYGFERQNSKKYTSMSDVQSKLATELIKAEDQMATSLDKSMPQHLSAYNQDSAVATAIETEVQRAMRHSTAKITSDLRQHHEEALVPLKQLNDELLAKNEELLDQLEHTENIAQRNESKYISSIEHKLARRKAEIAKRKLQLQRQELLLLQGKAASSFDSATTDADKHVQNVIIDRMRQNRLTILSEDEEDDTQFGFGDLASPAATLDRNTKRNSGMRHHSSITSLDGFGNSDDDNTPPQMRRRPTSSTSMERLERARGSSTQVSPTKQPMTDYEHLIGDPAAMWQYILQSDAPKEKKLDAAKKQLEYLKRQEEFTQTRLEAAERNLSRPRVINDDDTVFDDVFENGTVVDETTGEVFGFGSY